jgi:hypothetical protein
MRKGKLAGMDGGLSQKEQREAVRYVLEKHTELLQSLLNKQLRVFVLLSPGLS